MEIRHRYRKSGAHTTGGSGVVRRVALSHHRAHNVFKQPQ
jgi:hypothetical protein